MISKCVFEESNNPKERKIKNMSFVGMKICDDGIVAIADSKASRMDELGNIFQDTHNPLIKKVFTNDFFVVSTFGFNEIKTENGIVRISDWITDNINDLKGIYEFLEEFKKIASNDDRPFFFMFGTFFNNQYHIIKTKVENAEVVMWQDNTSTNFHMGGDQKYIDIFSKMKLNNISSSKECEKILSELLNYSISLFDWHEEYNSVGFPIETIIYKNPYL